MQSTNSHLSRPRLGQAPRKDLVLTSEADPKTKIQALDFFCGCGGTSLGLSLSGIELLLGLDFDADAAATYKHNFPGVAFIEEDIAIVSTEAIRQAISEKLDDDSALLISACAPCQPFSQMQRFSISEADPRFGVLSFLQEIIREFSPEYVFLENVPRYIDGGAKSSPFADFRGFLEALGYSCRAEVVECQSYGVPQVRKRLIMIATKLGEPAPWPKPTHGPGTGRGYQTVWNAIGTLPPLTAGGSYARIKNHVCASLSKTNLERIQATPPEGSRRSWPPHLRLDCHVDHRGHSDVYGRLRKETPAPAITTRCISLSNGRFGHPEQDRAISVREAACLQNFTRSFEFLGSLSAQARQVGNAVPVRLSQCVGRTIVNHWKAYLVEKSAGI